MGAVPAARAGLVVTPQCPSMPSYPLQPYAHLHFFALPPTLPRLLPPLPAWVPPGPLSLPRSWQEKQDGGGLDEGSGVRKKGGVRISSWSQAENLRAQALGAFGPWDKLHTPRPPLLALLRGKGPPFSRKLLSLGLHPFEGEPRKLAGMEPGEGRSSGLLAGSPG